MTRTTITLTRIIGPIASLFAFAAFAGAQTQGLLREREIVNQAGDGMWSAIGLLAVTSLAGAAWLWYRSNQGTHRVDNTPRNRYAGYYANKTYKTNEGGVDAEMELEWLRKARKTSVTKDLPKFGLDRESRAEENRSETKAFQERMRQMQFSQLPINAFSKLAPAKRYNPLPESEDPAVLSAIEQANDEYEEDEAIRELALRVLAAFNNKNSIEALSQIALYDLSANLRSKAVAALAGFDHESVFEPILLACADPTREVRAAAARGLFSLSFDRAHAWKRLIEANDSFRLTSAARAAVESGIVERSFDRLIHEDSKVAYEAFALVSLLIKAGETKEIFAAIERHKDERVRFALLHVLKVQKDERTIEELTRLALAMTKNPEMLTRLKDAISAIQASVQHEAWQTS
ncbi:MAG TPA: HEAT repeat domain-containing protein [Pyrinomonadaceae bacterium]|nr:HEAT repeat domain-containing protein [Pyrinomonadaceae bacterium]